MKILVDTNVLVSAALKDKDPEVTILFILSQPDLEWVACPEIIEEYREVLGRQKFGLPTEILQRWFDVLDWAVTVVHADIPIDFPRDQKDAKFLACALAAGAEFFITGDKDFSEAKKLVDTRIVSVTQFNKAFGITA